MGIKHTTRVAGTDISKSAIYGENHEIEGSTIVAADIADNAITTNKILDGAVTSAKIAVDTVIAADIATGAVGADELATDSVITSKILDLNVTTAKIAANAVTTAKILDANVTYAKLANDAKYTYYKAKHFTDIAFAQSEITGPRGYYYNNKTYVVFQGSAQDPYATYYDHTTKAWAAPVQVGTNPLTNDSHGTPSLVVDDLGFIHVFFGSHSGAGAASHSKSNSAESIAAWTAQAEMPPGNSATYPNLVKASNGDIYYFYRDLVNATHSTIDYVVSTDDGATWSAEATIIDPGAGTSAYPGGFAYDSVNGRIHVTWTDYVHADTRNEDCFHAYLKLLDLHMYDMAGNDLGTTISNAEAQANCKIWESGAENSNSGVIALDSNKNPGVIYQNTTTSRLYFIRWSGAAWEAAVNIVANSTSTATSEALLFYISGTTWEALIPLRMSATGPGTTILCDMALFNTINNGVNWFLKRNILSAAENDGTLIHQAQRITDFQSGLKAVICTGVYETLFGAGNWLQNTKLYGWGDSGFVYRVYSQ